MAEGTIDELARAAGAPDLFLFRRIAERRFAHIGGTGRGAGWAGIVEVSVADEPFLAGALAPGLVTRRSEVEAWHVFGPYYARSVAVVCLDDDVFVVFGSSVDDRIPGNDVELAATAAGALEAVREVDPAKRLADELEVVNALRDLLVAPATTFDQALQSVVEQATSALSCDLGIVLTRRFGRIAVSDKHGALPEDLDALRPALDAIRDHGDFPVCIQDASLRDLPHPFSVDDGVLAYYLLELREPVGGYLLLMHTVAAPRGFTLLCQSLGQRLVEAAGPLLENALAHDGLRHDLERAADEARRDVLTGLANRLAWDEALSTRADDTASVVLIDCRGLKRTNDTFGHQAGDRLLCRVGEIARLAVRGDDLVARIGGDEFAILLPGADEFAASMIVDRIEAAIETEPPVGSVEVRLAIGCATTHDGDVNAALVAADARMRAAKQTPGLASLQVGGT